MLIDVSKREEQNGQEIFLLLRQIELPYASNVSNFLLRFIPLLFL